MLHTHEVGSSNLPGPTKKAGVEPAFFVLTITGGSPGGHPLFYVKLQLHAGDFIIRGDAGFCHMMSGGEPEGRAGECHVVQTLTCAGALAFKDAGQLEVAGATAVTGELLGAGTLVLNAGGNFRKADASGFTGNLVVKGGKAILNRTFKPLPIKVADGAEVVWIESGTQIIFR